MAAFSISTFISPQHLYSGGLVGGILNGIGNGIVLACRSSIGGIGVLFLYPSKKTDVTVGHIHMVYSVLLCVCVSKFELDQLQKTVEEVAPTRFSWCRKVCTFGAISPGI